MIQRYATAAFLAFAVTSGLFYLMQALITKAGGELDESVGTVVEFVRLKKDSEPEIKKRQLPRKEKPEEPLPPPDLNLSQSNSLQDGLQGMVLAVGLDFALEGGPSIGAVASDRDIVPVVRVSPQYPPRAAERGTEGCVELRFGISTAGTVQDAEVTNSHPGTVFDRAALRAVRKWKYNPKIENGEPVERHGITVRLEFELKDG